MTSEPLYEEKNNNWLWWLIGLLALAAIFLWLLPLLGNDSDITPIVTDDSLVIDEDEQNQDFVNNSIVLVIGDTLIGSEITVTEVISDRLFRATGVDLPATGTLFYLDDSLDLLDAEGEIVVEQGDVFSVGATYTDDLSSQTLEPDESNVVNLERNVFLVTEISR
jgi:hypothetical protein